MPSTLEWIAVALGVCNIALLIRRSIWNYPFGMAMVALYFVIFRDQKLYSDMGLQVFFLAVQGWGWAAWARAGGLDGPVAVGRLSARMRWLWLGATALATLVWGVGMDRYTDAVQPHWDAAVAMGSVAAQVLLTQRKIENWLGWIAVDVLAIGLYANRGLHLTAGLYGLFLAMCIWGYFEWRGKQNA
ncbi:MAG: nicotinamide riboside transporter PnuC [Sphingopyxis sp.]